MFELKKTLLAGVAAGALIAPLAAFAQEPTENAVNAEITSTWDNNVDVTLN